jgi:hypothetical protein
MQMPTLTTLVSFNGANGNSPEGGLIADAAGDLFSTTSAGGAYGDGTTATALAARLVAHGWLSTLWHATHISVAYCPQWLGLLCLL